MPGLGKEINNAISSELLPLSDICILDISNVKMIKILKLKKIFNNNETENSVWEYEITSQAVSPLTYSWAWSSLGRR